MATLAVDWDGTLVDTDTQEWLPGATRFLHKLRGQGHRVFVHSARANSPTGADMIRQTLDKAGFRDIEVVAKPGADLYVDNQAFRFEGDYSPVLRLVPEKRQRVATVQPQRVRPGRIPTIVRLSDLNRLQ